MKGLKNVTFGMLGAGAIGGAVIERLLALGVPPSNLFACEIRAERRDELARLAITIADDPRNAARADLVVIAVPPVAVAPLLKRLKPVLTASQVIVSFAAAVPVTILERLLPSGITVARVNPNSPSRVGRGWNPVSWGRHISTTGRARIEAFLEALGDAPEVPDTEMNLYTALSAVGPTYFLPVFDAMIAAGVKAGLSRASSVAVAVGVARGVSDLVAAGPELPEQLKLLTGLRPLDHDQVRELVVTAIAAAWSRMDHLQKTMEAG